MTLTQETRMIEVTAYTGNDGGRNSSVIVSLTDPEVTALIVDEDSIRVTDGDGNPLAYQVLDYTAGEWASVIVNIKDADETNGNVIRFYTNADFGTADKVALRSFGGNAQANVAADRIAHTMTVYTHRAQNTGTNANEDSDPAGDFMAHPCVRRVDPSWWIAYEGDVDLAAGVPNFSHTYTNTPVLEVKYENPCIYGVTDDSDFTFQTGGVFDATNPLQSWPGAGFRSDATHDFNPFDNTLYVFDRRNDGSDTYLDRVKVTAGSGGSWLGVNVGAQEEIGETLTGELANVGKAPSIKFDSTGRLHMIAVGGGSDTGPINWLYSDSQGDTDSWEDVGTIETGGGTPNTAAWHGQISDLINGYYYYAYSEGENGENLNFSDELTTGRIRILRITKDDFENLRLDGWEECRYIIAQTQGGDSDWFNLGFYCPCVYEREDGTIDILTSAFAGTSHANGGASGATSGLDLVTGRIADVDLSDNTATTSDYWGKNWDQIDFTGFDAELVFDFSEDGSLIDRSGNNRDATLRLDPDRVSPDGGDSAAAAYDATEDAILFDGHSVLDVGTDTWTRADDEFVIHCEFRQDSLGAGDAEVRALILFGMFYEAEPSATPYGYAVCIRDRTTDTGDLMLALTLPGGTKTVDIYTLGPAVDDGAWHTLTAIRKTSNIKGTAFNEKIRFYLDGTYIGDFTNALGSGNIGGTGGSPRFGIGGSFTDRTNMSPWKFRPLGTDHDGYIRRFEVYTKAPQEHTKAPRTFGWDTANRADVPNVLTRVSAEREGTSMTVQWSLSSTGDTATQVDIEYADNPYFTDSTTVQATATDGSKRITGLTSDDVWVRVRPINATEFSYWSSSLSVVSSEPSRHRTRDDRRQAMLRRF